MADTSYTYLGLVNKVLIELNEVPIENSVEFESVTGFHESVKGYVNDAIETILNEEDNEWSFQRGLATETLLTNGTLEYSLEADASQVDWDSFYIPAQTISSVDIPAKKLPYRPYVEFRDNDMISALNMESSGYSIPEYVTRTSENKFAIFPPADRAYQVKYDYFIEFEPLVNSSDVPIIPRRFRRAIIEYAKSLAFEFRDNLESQQLSMQKAEDLTNKMRRTLIPQPDTMVFIGG